MRENIKVNKEGISIEYNESDRYRLCIGDKKGEWFHYTNIAVLDNYIGFSEYWGYGRQNQIYELKGFAKVKQVSP